MDSGTFADLMGTAWMRANSPQIVSQPKPSKITFSFGNDRPPTIGSVSVEMTCQDNTGQPITFILSDVNIVDNSPAPLLFGYQSQAKYDLLTRPHNNTIIKYSANDTEGHLCLIIQPRTTCLYTRQELALVHRQFGQKLVADVLKAFPSGTFTNNDIRLLNEIAASCKPCQEYAQLPRRPRYNLPSRPIYFNRLIQTDTFTIAGYPKPVLDITCNDTDFGLGLFLENKTAEIIFALLYIKWFTVIGLPETVLGDRGGEFENQLLSDGLASLGVFYRLAPTEAPWSIGSVERHHAPIRKAFLMIMAETPLLSPHLALAMAYKARNDTPRSHGMSPHEAAFGETPRLLVGDNSHSTHGISIRHKAMQLARASMESFTAKDRLNKALSHPSHKVPFVAVGQHVVFHRAKSQKWLHGICTALDGSTVYIEHNGQIFSSHESRVKPFVTPPSLRHNTPNTPIPSKTKTSHQPSLDPTVQVFLTHNKQPFRPSSPLIPHNNPRHPRWDNAKQTEIAQFRSLQAMDTVPIDKVPLGSFVYPYKWHCTESHTRGNGKPPLRARYVVQGQLDSDKHNNVATSPVVSLRAVRTTLAVASILQWNLQTQDFKRAYLQSEPLDTPIYCKIPPEAGEPADHIWAFKLPLYGKDDSGRKFYFTIDKSVTKHMPDISRSSAFDAVYIIPKEGILSFYSDDTKAAGTPSFLYKVSLFTRNFNTHKSDLDNIKFVGMHADVSVSGITVQLNSYIDALHELPETADHTSFKRLAAQLLWIGRVARPDVLCDAVKLMGKSRTTPELIKRVNAVLTHAKQLKPSITFPRLNPDNLRLHVYTDFSGSHQTSQEHHHLGYLIGLSDQTNSFSPIHWSSHKPKRVCRGPGAGELVALCDGLNAALDIHTLIQEATSRRIPLSAYTDATSVHDVCSGFMEPADLQGKSDVHFIRQLLQRGPLSELNRIDSADNPADALSKSSFTATKPNTTLTNFLHSGKLHVAVRKTTTPDVASKVPRPDLKFKH